MQNKKRRKKNRRKQVFLSWCLLITLIIFLGTIGFGVGHYFLSSDDSSISDNKEISTDVYEQEDTEILEITEDKETESGTYENTEPEEENELVNKTENQEIETADKVEVILQEMTLEEKVAQLFFITPEALTDVSVVTAAGDATKTALQEYPVGGLVYFKQNLIEPKQTKQMLKATQEMAMETCGFPIFLGVDEEGGRVLRIGSNSAFGVEKVEAMGTLANEGNPDIIYDASDTIGAYLSELGFNVDFAPDADVLTNSENQVIGDRSFGIEPNSVAQLSWEYVKGLHNNNILATYKHFPGHGGTTEDSHTGKAYLYKSLNELRETELVPFQDGAEKGVDFIMVSHVSVPEVIGDETPTSLSEIMITDTLRNEFNYEGIIITDSMGMNAVSGYYSPKEAAVKAILAGNDMLLMPADFKSAYKGVIQAVNEGEITQQRIDESVRRILTAKLKWTEE